MPFLYTDIEDDVVTRLTALLPEGYKVIPMPEKENQFDVGKNKVLVLVAYEDSSFGGTDSMDIVNQAETVTVLCNVKSSRLRGSFSINEALQLLKVAMVGFKPRNLSKLIASKIEFDERNANDNYFSYNFSLTGKKRNVEVPDEEVLPLLKTLTFNSGEGDFFDQDFVSPDFLTSTTWLQINSTTP